MTFGEKLRALREHHELTQGELASCLDLSDHSHIAHLERPRRLDSQKVDAPSPELALAIASLFDVSADYLFRDAIPAQPVPASRIVPLPRNGVRIRALGTKIRHLRQQQGWSLTELGRRLRPSPDVPAYTRHYVSNLEAGRRLPSIYLLIRLAAVFGTTIDFLLRDDLPVEAEQTHRWQGNE